jgi:chromosome segregation ATPase
MSARKKVGISDLLRDEVQKGVESPVIEVKAETVSDVSEPVSKTAIVAPKIVDESKAKISTLETSLAQSQQQQESLLQTIADLQKDLQLSQTNVELLQKSLAAIESNKNELDQQLVEVKRDNLRLAEANIQLSTQVADLSKSVESAQQSLKPSVEAAQTSQLVTQHQTSQNQASQNTRATPRKQPVDQPYANRDRPAYSRPMGSNEQLQRINNKNIGWMD